MSRLWVVGVWAGFAGLVGLLFLGAGLWGRLHASPEAAKAPTDAELAKAEAEARFDRRHLALNELMQEADLYCTGSGNESWHLNQQLLQLGIQPADLKPHLPSATLEIRHKGEVAYLCEVQVAAVYHKPSEMLTWAWAEPDLPDRVKQHASQVKRFGLNRGGIAGLNPEEYAQGISEKKIHPISALTTERFKCSPATAMQNLHITAYLNRAQGAIRAQRGDETLLLSVVSWEAVSEHAKPYRRPDWFGRFAEPPEPPPITPEDSENGNGQTSASESSKD